MARKNVLDPVDIATNQSLAASFNSASTAVPFQDNLAYQIVVNTTNSTGDFVLQGSLDNSNWADLLACGSVAAANDVILVNANQIPFKYVRLKYTSTVAGTGTCSIKLMARTVGA